MVNNIKLRGCESNDVERILASLTCLWRPAGQDIKHVFFKV